MEVTTMRTPYLVQGCGITAICEEGEVMLWILQRIVEKGGVPEVRFYQGDK